ncbi:MAG: DUF4386 family protein [Aureispira sp.]
MGLLLFGGYLISLGYLCGQQGEVPKLWHILLMWAGVGYMVLHAEPYIWNRFESYQLFLELLFIPAMILGEVGLAVWFLLQKKKTPLFFQVHP